MQKILVTGANGQLGSELQGLSQHYPQFEFVFTDRKEFPLDDLDNMATSLDHINPGLIINAGAYTAVDKAETERELADAVNHLAVAAMAKWAAQHAAKVLHVSTDYVFEGSSKTPLSEVAPTAPINWYGETKLRGEQALLSQLPEAVVIRTAWVYSEYGNNFVKTMLRLMEERDSIGVVNDQIGAPTWAADLAKVILDIVVSQNWVPGIFHYSNAGEISWFDFATAIQELSGLECDVKAVTSAQFPTPAKRPNYSLLDTTKIKGTYHLSIPDWKDSLERMLTTYM